MNGLDHAIVVETEGGCIVSLKVIPRSSKNQIVGEEQGSLKIKLRAPPVEGAANEALLKFLAKIFKIPKNSLSLMSGHQSKHKKVKIQGLKALEVLEVLQKI